MDNSNEILLLRMCVGEYNEIEKNIGYETINLFRCDNGANYLYVPSTGKVGKTRRIGTVLLLKKLYTNKGKDTAKHTEQIIAKAVGLELVPKFSTASNGEPSELREYKDCCNYIEANNITYGGLKQLSIYKDNVKRNGEPDETPLMLTYKAKDVFFAKKPLTIYTNQAKGQKGTNLGDTNFGRSHRVYSQSKEPLQYNKLKAIVEDTSLWHTENLTQKIPRNLEPDSVFADLLAALGIQMSEVKNSGFEIIHKRFLNSIKEQILK